MKTRKASDAYDRVKRTSATEPSCPLQREDWDFESLVKDELLFCWSYEFSRHVPWLKEVFALAISELVENPPHMADELGFCADGLWLYSTYRDFKSRNGGNLPYMASILLRAGFPNTPYLKLRKVGRGVRSEKELEIFVDNNEKYSPCRKMPAPPPGEMIEVKSSFILLDLNWSYSNKKITDSFKSLLPKLRSEMGVKAASGKGFDVNEGLRSDLKALGAYRLRNYLTADEARKFSQKNSAKKNAIYQYPSEYYDAKITVQKLLKRNFKTDVSNHDSFFSNYSL